MIAKAEFPHRGVFQAQGGRGKGIQESEGWKQNEALTAVAGTALLNALHDKLSVADQRVRASAFEQAHGYIEICRIAHGIHALIKKSFPRKPNPRKERVDIEVRRGIAFVPEPEKAK